VGLIPKPWLVVAVLVAIAASGALGFRSGARLERAEILQEQQEAIEAVRLREKRLMKGAERVAELVYQENQELEARADRADRALASLRAEIDRRARAAEAAPSAGADGGSAGALLAECAGRYRDLARDADRLRAKLLGLQAYVREICAQ
jgi:septal ring factor EnvC (AmiA/AmiB activator)